MKPSLTDEQLLFLCNVIRKVKNLKTIVWKGQYKSRQLKVAKDVLKRLLDGGIVPENYDARYIKCESNAVVRDSLGIDLTKLEFPAVHYYTSIGVGVRVPARDIPVSAVVNETSQPQGVNDSGVVEESTFPIVNYEDEVSHHVDVCDEGGIQLDNESSSVLGEVRGRCTLSGIQGVTGSLKTFESVMTAWAVNNDVPRSHLSSLLKTLRDTGVTIPRKLSVTAKTLFAKIPSEIRDKLVVVKLYEDGETERSVGLTEGRNQRERPATTTDIGHRRRREVVGHYVHFGVLEGILGNSPGSLFILHVQNLRV